MTDDFHLNMSLLFLKWPEGSLESKMVEFFLVKEVICLHFMVGTHEKTVLT